jgi:hypothetical protein
MALLSELEASVRGSTDQVDTGRTPQSLIYAFANEEYEEVVRRVAGIFPDFYRAYSADLSIAVTTSPYIDVAALTTAFTFLTVQRKINDRYFDIDPASSPNPEVDAKITWRQRGFFGTGCKIDVFPPEASVGDYRVHYLAFPGALSGASDVIKLPLGGLKYMAACVSARVRHREEEDENYMINVRDTAFASLVRNLGPAGVIGTRGRY